MKKSMLICLVGIAFAGALLQSCSEKKADTSEVIVSEEVLLPAEEKGDLQDPQVLTIQNMRDAYKGETTAHFKYAAYSKKAAEEGHPEIAKLFKAASGAELIYAGNHKVVLIRMGEAIPEITPEFTVESTIDNSKESIEGESYEYNTMYPEFLKNVNASGNYMAQISFTYAYKVEQKHRDFYIAALAALEAGTDNTLTLLFAPYLWEYLCHNGTQSLRNFYDRLQTVYKGVEFVEIDGIL